jgi:hypothetical protein
MPEWERGECRSRTCRGRRVRKARVLEWGERVGRDAYPSTMATILCYWEVLRKPPMPVI